MRPLHPITESGKRGEQSCNYFIPSLCSPSASTIVIPATPIMLSCRSTAPNGKADALSPRVSAFPGPERWQPLPSPVTPVGRRASTPTRLPLPFDSNLRVSRVGMNTCCGVRSLCCGSYGCLASLPSWPGPETPGAGDVETSSLDVGCIGLVPVLSDMSTSSRYAARPEQGAPYVWNRIRPKPCPVLYSVGCSVYRLLCDPGGDDMSLDYTADK